MTPHVVIFDLDGVIRDWNDEDLGLMESSFGLEPGEILATAFDGDLGHAAVTGALTYREWMDEIRERVIGAHGPHVAGALDEWEANVGHVDTEMLEVLRAVRRHCPAAVLSNGTTRLRRDLHALDLHDEFDTIFNTAELSVAKPDPAVFRLVLDRLGAAPEATLFIDDLAPNVDAARGVGLTAHQHTGSEGTVEFLRAHGVHV